MKKAKVFVDGVEAGILSELKQGRKYHFEYFKNYNGCPVSLEMPIKNNVYEYDRFPPYFEGVLPEGIMLEGMLKINKIDRDDYMSQLIAVGRDLVGNVEVVEIKE